MKRTAYTGYRKWHKLYRPGESFDKDNFNYLQIDNGGVAFTILKHNPHNMLFRHIAAGILSGFPLWDTVVYAVHDVLLRKFTTYYKFWSVK